MTGTGALAAQKARSAMAEVCHNCRVLATPDVGQGQQFTGIPKVI